MLLGVGIAAALLAVGGLIGASFVKSPQQLAADTAAPPATVTTATVVSQVLTSSVEMRGVVYPATQYDVYASAPSSSSSSSSGAGSASAAGRPRRSGSAVYISKLDVAAGDTITNGEQLAEIDGQPLFALTGTVPAWRDLTPGESGPDVTELQKALASLGYYDDGDTPGYFGSATEYAVYLYYEHLGYTPPSSGGVPAADVVFLPSLPATVVAVNGATGEQPGQPFLELAARGSLALTGELPPAYAGQVKSGLKVTIYDEVTGIHATGTVADLGTATTVSADRSGGGHRGRLGFGGLFGVRRLRVYPDLGLGVGQLRARAPAARARRVFIPLTVHPSTAAGRGAERRERPGHRPDRADRGAGAHGAGRRDRHHRVRHELRHRGGRARQADPGPGDAGHFRERLRPGDAR